MSNYKQKISFNYFSLRSIIFVAILTLSSLVYSAMAMKLTGRVSDEKGELLIGVNITEKGQNNAVITDINGAYTINVKGPGSVILVSYVGYKKQEFKIGNNTVFDIVMVEEESALNEVVVVGYGEQRKVSVIGAQSQLKSKDLKFPTGNLSSAISGRLAGLVTVQRSGEPGHDDSDIWIRGISSFTNQDTRPLVLVDGVERSFANLDPEDIESFSVLKDASATAVYGVRGANGVIIIKTKPGKASKPQFTVIYNKGLTRLTQKVDMADAYQYMSAANDAYGSVKYSPEYIEATRKADGLIPNDNPKMYNKYLYPNVKWMDEIFNDFAENQKANLSVRGGSPNAAYYLSLSYFDEVGLTKVDNLAKYNSTMRFSRYNFTTNINLKVSNKTTIDVGVQGFVGQGNYPYISPSDAFKQAMLISPVEFPATYPGGQIPGRNPNGDSRNPYADITSRGYKTEYENQINSNLRVSQDLDFWEWSKGLKAFAMYAFDVKLAHNVGYGKRENTYYPSASKDETTGLWIDSAEKPLYDADGNLIFGTPTYTGTSILGFEPSVGLSHNNYLEAGLTYERLFENDHRVSALCLFNQKIVTNNTAGNYVNSIPSKNRGIAGRATYSFKDRYFTEFNIGVNGSENFAPSNRYGAFPALGFGWAVSNEPFWKPIIDYVSYFKIRYTNGLVGADAIPNRRFGFTDIMDASQAGYTFGNNSLSGVALTEYGTPVRWSTSRKQDLGFDLKFFKDKLAVNVDLFKEHRTDIFLRRAGVPDLIGLASKPYGNLGIVDNKGVEVSLDYGQAIQKNMFLTIRGNFTWNRAVVVEDDSPIQEQPWLNTRGVSINSTWGYQALGLFTSEEEIASSPRQFGETNPGDNTRVGDIKYKDIDGNGVIDSYDMTVIGKGDVPPMYYGFGADFSWGNFSIGALFQGTLDADRLISGTSIQPFSGDGGLGNLYSNIDDRANNYIQVDENGVETLTNQNVFYPRLAWGGATAANVNNFKPSTWWIKDVSFLRLKQFSMGYQFPKAWVDMIGFSNGKIFVMGSNLLTWTKFKLWDPELNTSNGTSYPNVTTYSLGLSFNF